MSFVHLHSHDEYSLLDGCGTAKHFAARAAEMGQPALASTNHGTLAGILHHINACRDAGVLPITGCEVYYRPNRKVQGQKEWQYRYFHLTLLAAGAQGWTNLMRLVSEAYISGFYSKPCVDPELLRRHSEGLICGTGCLGGWLCNCIANEDERAVEAWMIELKSIFRDRLFAEIMPNALPEQQQRNPIIIDIADRHGVVKCATADAHAPEREWVQAPEDQSSTHDVLLMINTNSSLKKRDEKRAAGQDVFEFKDNTYYLQSEQEMRDNFARNHPGISVSVVDEMIKNTVMVASWTTPFLISRHDKLPKFDRGEPDIEILRRLTYEGLTLHGTRHNPEYEERAEEELKQIEERGVAAYFLMVRDVVEWAESDRGLPDENGYEAPGQKEPIMVGPGRGSAGGSLVSDSVGITNMDPIAYRCLFERFLNPARKGLPDIDVDFPADRIDEIEEYTKRKFGRDHVVDIIAHSTFGPRASIRRVGMALCLPFELIDEAAKSIDELDRTPLEDMRRVNQFVDELAERYPDAWLHMCRLQGQIYGKSEHAAALLVTPPESPVQDVIPIERVGGQNGKLITAWGERAGKGNQIISDYGYNKFDWLRVTELDKQAYACKLIYEETGERLNNLRDLPVHRDPFATEPEVMQGFADGLFVGVFQWAAVANKLTRRLKPESLFDLAAINALIRPGARGAGADVNYLERKRGEQEVVYWHENLEPYLDYTYGIMVFQEQLIEVVHQLGGLTRSEADNFRKIASKLYREPAYAREQMGVWYEPIKAAFMEHGISAEDFGEPTGGGKDGTEATGIWGNFLSFSDYSFNLPHAAGYSLCAYRDMWLKVHYPRQFYAALLSKGMPQKKERRIEVKQRTVREARNRGFETLLPDINESGIDYTVTSNGIRVGLGSIRNVGPVAAREVVVKRPIADGYRLQPGYSSYQDFEARTVPKRCNRTAKAALICAGAFDSFGLRDDYTEEKIDELEREFVGVSLSSVYAITNYSDIIDERIWSEEEFDEAPDGTLVTIAGEVIATKDWRDKKGGLMCFVTLAYGPDEFNVTFFAHTYKLYAPLIHSRRPIILIGRKNSHNKRTGIVPLDPEPKLNADNSVVLAFGDDGLMHEVWTHYVQDVDELAKLVRGTQEPTDLVSA